MSEITVCILAYNAEKYIDRTLQSLEKQEAEFCYLLINDGSSDNTLKVCEEFKKVSKRKVTVHDFHVNHGTAFCRDWALHHVETELMMFFDADDIALPGLIQKLKDKIDSDKKYIAVSCFSQYIDVDGNKLKGGQFLGATTEQEFFSRAEAGKLTFMLPITLFYREKAILVGGYRQEGFPKATFRYQDLSEDLDLWSRMSDLYSEGYVMITIPETLFLYRKMPGSLSTGKDKQLAMNYKIAYIKNNLKLRRTSKPEITYIDFLEDMTKREKYAIEKEFKAGYEYRQAAFLVVEKKYLAAINHLVKAMIVSPKFMLQKLKANFGF